MIVRCLVMPVTTAPLVIDQIRNALWEDGITIALFALGFLFCLYGLVTGLKLFRQGFAVWSNDPISAGEVHLADGVVELEGTAEVLDETVESPYTDTSCLVYEYKKERQQRDHGDESQGSDWTTVASGSDGVPFLLADDSGTVAVDPEGGEYALGTDSTESGTRTRKHENRLEPGDPIHVYGEKRAAAERREDALDQQQYYVGDGDQVSQYRITDGSETWAVAGLLAKGIFVTAICGVLAAVCGLFVLDLLGFGSFVPG